MSATAQQAAFATGVLPDLYAFHRYTRNSACLYSAPAAAVFMADAGLSPALSPRTDRATYAPFTPNDSGQRSHPPYYRGCWHGVSRCFLTRYRQVGKIRYSSRATEVYTPRSFIPHAASLRQPLGHCARFPTAASRRSLGRLSVPMWLAILSDQLPVVALVSRYLTN